LFIGRSVTRELAVARLQSDFVSAVSHEFRTPLTTLCQLSELLMAGRVPADADRRQYYELLHNESHRLRRLVEGLLNFGRLEAGRMQFRFEPLDIAALVREAIGEFTDGPSACGHRFEIDTRGDTALVVGDRDALRCVFSNLFENAVKYSPLSDRVWVDVARHDRRLEIAVRDRGLGIPRDEQRRIFDKFVRGSTTRDVRGTGVGLAMARQIVVAHGGEITVVSEPGQGSTFTIVLPASSTN
jgi:signal transduction histidine kinase